MGATLSKLAQVATWDVMVAVSVGLAVGLAGAYVASVGFEQFLFHVEPRSLDAYAGVVPNASAPAATGPADESPKPGTESENAKESSL